MRSNSIVLGLTIALIGLPVPALAAKTGITDCQAITASDSYVLKNNLPGPAGLLPSGNCLEINADFVGISMAGFTITGTGALNSAGITDLGAGNGRQGIDISGGSIVNFGTGISMLFSNDVRVTGMQLIDNVVNGISVGNRSLVSGNGVSGPVNGLTGITAGLGSRVSSNLVSDYLNGIVASIGSTVRGNNVVQKTGGFDPVGIRVFCPSSVSGNTIIEDTFGVGDIELLFVGTPSECDQLEFNNLGTVTVLPGIT